MSPILLMRQIPIERNLPAKKYSDVLTTNNQDVNACSPRDRSARSKVRLR
jgi:hypothetical protein